MESNVPLEFNRVSKLFFDFSAVSDLSFSVPKGKIFGLLGANGAGKTTSIRMVLDIVKPSSGSIRVLGENTIKKIRDRVGYLPEERGLYKKSKVLETICYFARLKGMDGHKARRRATALLEKHGLAEFSKYKIEALSKGMSQKVQLLSTVAHEPELLILDEPFSGLDPVNQQVLEQMILEMAANGQTIIFSTHVMQHAERLCDRLLLMARGNKVFEGTVDEARNTLPHTITIETGADVATLQQHELIEKIEPVTGGESDIEKSSGPISRWEVYLKENADPQKILQYCFANDILLRSFEQKTPTLHDVFVKLVGSHQSSVQQSGQQESKQLISEESEEVVV